MLQATEKPSDPSLSVPIGEPPTLKTTLWMSLDPVAVSVTVPDTAVDGADTVSVGASLSTKIVVVALRRLPAWSTAITRTSVGPSGEAVESQAVEYGEEPLSTSTWLNPAAPAGLTSKRTSRIPETPSAAVAVIAITFRRTAPAGGAVSAIVGSSLSTVLPVRAWTVGLPRLSRKVTWRSYAMSATVVVSQSTCTRRCRWR